MMLGSLEDMSLNQCMREMVDAYDKNDHGKVKALAHSLKGASAYIGASRLHYMCYFIQHHYVEHNYREMMEYYPSLVEAAIEFRIYHRKLIAKSNGERYTVIPDHERCDHSSQFRLLKDQSSGYTYCCRHNQTIQ
jgi:HPt (histidine-containing phosphotransfer) domain-containing protein